MTYPFPGMNPWLEDPDLWRDVRHSLITAIRDELSPQLAPRYFVAVETHTYITRPDPLYQRTRFPDVMVLQTDRAPVKTARAYAPTIEPILVELPEVEPLIEGFLQVRLVPSGEIVTVIELLSHTNKRKGEHRLEYLEKRDSLINSHIHFVELDLLRAGNPMPQTDPSPSDYRFFVRRRENHFLAHVYPFHVQDPIPQFPLPLLPDDQEPSSTLARC